MADVTFSALGGRVLADAESAYRDAAVKVVDHVLDRVRGSAPRLTGEFAASFESYAGEDAAPGSVAGVRIGEPFGVGTTHPGANKLSFHGHSKKVPKNWLDTSVRAAVQGAQS